MFEVTASIVCFRNDPDELRNAMTSFLNCGLRKHLFVIDNSPTDTLRSVANLRDTTYEFVGGNIGFGAAHNLVLRNSWTRSKYHLVLNPDIDFDSGCMEKLVGFMDENRRTGLVMPRVVYQDGSTQHLCRKLPTPFDLFARRFLPQAFSDHFAERLAQYEFRHKDLTRVLAVPNLCGCFMLLRTSALQAAGVFDERFFMYLEDTDLSRRVHQLFETLYYPGVTVRHRYERGSYKNLRLLRYHTMSAIRYFNKWGWLFDRERDYMNSRAMAQSGTAIDSRASSWRASDTAQDLQHSTLL